MYYGQSPESFISVLTICFKYNDNDKEYYKIYYKVEFLFCDVCDVRHHDTGLLQKRMENNFFDQTFADLMGRRTARVWYNNNKIISLHIVKKANGEQFFSIETFADLMGREPRGYI